MAEQRDDFAPRTDDDLVLQAAYAAEFGADGLTSDPDEKRAVGARKLRVGDLRGRAIADLAVRLDEHSLLHRADDTARLAALRFVERRLVEGNKVAAYGEEGTFSGFLRRVIKNLLLDWLRSPAGKAELRRAEHDGSDRFEIAGDEQAPTLPREEHERRRRLTLHHLVAVRAIQTLPAGRGVPLRLALWPAYEHDEEELRVISAFAHCHESSPGQAEARACDSGKRCTLPPDGWREAHGNEVQAAKNHEPEGLSRRSIAELTRIGHGKALAKREGAICERISKGRLMLIAALRRSAVDGDVT